jgi:hypothetical protein
MEESDNSIEAIQTKKSKAWIWILIILVVAVIGIYFWLSGGINDEGFLEDNFKAGCDDLTGNEVENFDFIKVGSEKYGDFCVERLSDPITEDVGSGKTYIKVEDFDGFSGEIGDTSTGIFKVIDPSCGNLGIKDTDCYLVESLCKDKEGYYEIVSCPLGCSRGNCNPPERYDRLIAQDIGEYEYVEATSLQRVDQIYYKATYKNNGREFNVFVRVFSSLSDKEEWVDGLLFNYPEVSVKEGITLHENDNYVSEDVHGFFWEHEDFIITLTEIKSDESLLEAYLSKYS